MNITPPLPFGQTMIMVLVVALGTIVTRFLAFILFPENRPTPPYMEYLGKTLPFAAIGMLVVYCLKGITFTAGSRGLPEAIAIVTVVLLHWWKRNTLLSVATGTVLYMFLVQVVFTIV